MERPRAESVGWGGELASSAGGHLPWLVQLRWEALVGQFATILVARYALGIPLELQALLAVLAVEVLTNLLLEAYARRASVPLSPAGERRARRLEGAVLALDSLLLTALLYFSGGVVNPFATFFIVHVVLAAVLLGARYAYFVSALSFACLWFLYLVHEPLAELEHHPALRLAGLVVSLGLTAAITTFFVTRVTRALARRSRELEEQRARRERAERLESLGTLAAGAAHELSTPLSTIAVVAKELEIRLADADEEVIADARLVRSEVARCRRILDRLRLESGEQVGEAEVSFAPQELCARALADLAGAERVEVHVALAAAELRFRGPRESLALALRALLSNALDASGEEAVELEVERAGNDLVLTVLDRGEGMDPERVRRAGEPFFTTKAPGEGLGLGLFLARSVFERLGGGLELASAPGRGTRAWVRLPLERLSWRPETQESGGASAADSF